LSLNANIVVIPLVHILLNVESKPIVKEMIHIVVVQESPTIKVVQNVMRIVRLLKTE
jgi:hypothetical protein